MVKLVACVALGRDINGWWRGNGEVATGDQQYFWRTGVAWTGRVLSTMLISIEQCMRKSSGKCAKDTGKLAC